eukprot:6985671-Alexandrium_andersonii.AAC.1
MAVEHSARRNRGLAGGVRSWNCVDPGTASKLVTQNSGGLRVAPFFRAGTESVDEAGPLACQRPGGWGWARSELESAHREIGFVSVSCVRVRRRYVSGRDD